MLNLTSDLAVDACEILEYNDVDDPDEDDFLNAADDAITSYRDNVPSVYTVAETAKQLWWIEHE